MSRSLQSYKKELKSRDEREVERLLSQPIDWPVMRDEDPSLAPRTYRDVRDTLLRVAEERKSEGLPFADDELPPPAVPSLAEKTATRQMNHDPYFVYRSPLRAIGLEPRVVRGENGEPECFLAFRDNYDEHRIVRLVGPWNLCDLPETIEIKIDRKRAKECPGQTVGELLDIIDWINWAERTREDRQMVQLRDAGLPYGDIAAQFGCAKATVQQRIGAFCREHHGSEKPDRSRLLENTSCHFKCNVASQECLHPMKPGCHWKAVADQAGAIGTGRELPVSQLYDSGTDLGEAINGALCQAQRDGSHSVMVAVDSPDSDEGQPV